MKRSVLFAVVLGLIVAAAPAAGSQEAGPPPDKTQTVGGAVVVPTPSNVSGGPRRVLLATNRAANGVNGWMFDVDQDTVYGSFDLKLTGNPTGQGDLNIIFYSDTGDVGATPPVATAQFLSTSAEEKGFIPEGSKIAMVFISGGAAVSFDYTAKSAPVINIGTSSLDLTVPVGTTVRWFNGTDAPTFVKHTPSTGKPSFDSAVEFPGGIPAGGLFKHTFEGAGRFAYATATETGTITVE